jgi:hypothetical protein
MFKEQAMNPPDAAYEEAIHICILIVAFLFGVLIGTMVEFLWGVWLRLEVKKEEINFLRQCLDEADKRHDK